MFVPSEEWNLFQYSESVSELARSIIPTFDAVVDDHAFACAVMSNFTVPAGHDELYPFATLNDARFVPIVGCDVHLVDVDANPESYDVNVFAVQLHDHDSYSDSSAEMIVRSLNNDALKFRYDRATCPEPLSPSFNSAAPD